MIKAFDNLINTYTHLLQRCYDALDPNATPESREQLRQSLKKYLDQGNKDTTPQP